MASSLLLLILILGAAFVYFTTPDERTRLISESQIWIRQAREAADRYRPECGPFGEALLERTPMIVATPALLAFNALVFLGMLFGSGSFGDPETLLGWGGSFGPRTTNGEWWRLVASMFVHGGLFHLLFNMAAMGVLGLVLERLYGRFAFIAIYLGAGLLANVVGLALHPVVVSFGSAGAVFGVVGLLLASLVAGRVFAGSLAIPLPVLARLAPPTGLFLLYSMATGHVGLPELAGCAVGVLSGFALSSGVKEHAPPFLRVAGTFGVPVMIAVVFAVPLRGMANVRPEIARVLDVEARTAKAYVDTDATYRNTSVTTLRLAEVIEKKILPELASTRARLDALERVPRQDQEVVRVAQEYLRLREKAWRTRDDGLRKPNMAKLREADHAERTALEAFDRLKAVSEQ